MLKSACRIPAYAFNHRGSALSDIASACFKAVIMLLQAAFNIPQAVIGKAQATVIRMPADFGKLAGIIIIVQAITSRPQAKIIMRQATKCMLQAEVMLV